MGNDATGARAYADLEGGHAEKAAGGESGHDPHAKSGPDWKGDVCQCCGEQTPGPGPCARAPLALPAPAGVLARAASQPRAACEPRVRAGADSPATLQATGWT